MLNLRPMQHLDSAQVAFLQRELESLDKQPYVALLPGNKARLYIPDQPGIAEWQESYIYKMYTRTGRGRKGGKNVNSLPRAGLTMTPVTRRIEQFPLSYGWTVREIQQAAATGTPLDSLTVMAARMAAARQIDDFLAKGNGSDIDGLYTNAQIAILTPTTKTGGAAWTTPGNLPDEIIADFSKVLEELLDGLKQTDAPGFDKFVFLIPTKQYAFIANTPRSPQSDTSILKWLIENSPWIESIEPWWQGDGAGAGGSSDRLVAYPRTPLAVAGIVPQEFRPLSPQERDLEIVVPVTASCGGTIIRYPVACRYMDGI
jgi:hypothetical protein